MTWRPHPILPVPEATATVFKAAFPKGNLYAMRQLPVRVKSPVTRRLYPAPYMIDISLDSVIWITSKV